jgi:hypothetical protein
MGEAKRRKAADPNYGHPKPVRPGLVVSAPVEIEGTRANIRSSNLDPQELRFSLLFWNRLVWPASRAIYLASGPDEQFLEQAGILSRPEYTFSGDGAQGLARTHIHALIDLDSREPGQWSLAQGENSLLLKDNLLERDVGVLLELQHAIPVPDKDVPLNEILEFKNRRKDELQLLRTELDGFVAAINQAEDKAAELKNHVAKVDAACVDALRVSREWQFPVRLTNLKASVEFRPFVTAAGGMAAFALGTANALPMSASVLAGISGALAVSAPALKLSGDFGWRGLKRRLGPYRYVYQFHNELF